MQESPSFKSLINKYPRYLKRLCDFFDDKPVTENIYMSLCGVLNLKYSRNRASTYDILNAAWDGQLSVDDFDLVLESLKQDGVRVEGAKEIYEELKKVGLGEDLKRKREHQIEEQRYKVTSKRIVFKQPQKTNFLLWLVIHGPKLVKNWSIDACKKVSSVLDVASPRRNYEALAIEIGATQTQIRTIKGTGDLLNLSFTKYKNTVDILEALDRLDQTAAWNAFFEAYPSSLIFNPANNNN